MLNKDSTGDKGEGDNLNISIRSYFMQTACSAGRKKTPTATISTSKAG